LCGGCRLKAKHGIQTESGIRYVVGAVALLFVALAVIVLATDGSRLEEETVSAFGPTPEDVPPTPTSTLTPTATPAAPDPGEETPEPVALEVEVADTEAQPLVDDFYIPNFVAGSDRTESGTASSTAVATPTPIPAPPVAAAPQAQPTPTPHTHPPTPTPEPQPQAESEPTPKSENTGSGPTAAQWEALRQCESGGNYSIVSGNGLYHGAYQFNQGTWDSTASGVWPQLVGVDPANASPANQDKMALRLYALRSWFPWPVCGKNLI
jgi:hypothetical protein